MKMIYSTQALCAAAALFFAGSALAAPHPAPFSVAASDDSRIPKGNYGKGDPIKWGSKRSPGYFGSGNGESTCGSDYGSIWQCNADQQWTVEDCQSRSQPGKWCGCKEETSNNMLNMAVHAKCVFYKPGDVIDGVQKDAVPTDEEC